jgi:hypothetical protein
VHAKHTLGYSLALLLLLTLPGFGRQEFAQEVTFSPAHFYLGDEVILNFWLAREEGEQIESGLYPQNDNLIIQEIVILPNQHRTYVSIRFKSFAVGTQYLSLYFDDISVQEITITTRSLIAEGYDQARTIYAPRLLENTQLVLILTTMFLVFIVPVILLSIHLSKRIYAHYTNSKLLPYRIFVRTLTGLIRSESQLSDTQYYSQLSNAIRQYLTHQLNLAGLSSATPEEVEVLLAGYVEDERSKGLAEFFKRSDAIRFGGRFAEVGEREADTNFILALAKISEKWRPEAAVSV